MIPAQVRRKQSYFRDIESIHTATSIVGGKRYSVQERNRTTSILLSHRDGRLREELTVANQWSYLKNGKKNAGGHEPPRGDPGGRNRWHAS